LPPSSRAIADCVVPSRLASSDCESFAEVRARINASSDGVLSVGSVVPGTNLGIHEQFRFEISEFGHAITLLREPV